MLLLVNGAPILAARCFDPVLSYPIDAGKLASDGRPLLGSSKTWRGLVAAALAGNLLGLVFNWPVFITIGFTLSAMIGDCFASFCKRRLGLRPSEQAIGLDHLPESFLPMLFIVVAMDLPASLVLVIPISFFLIAIGLSRLLYLVHLRKRPY